MKSLSATAAPIVAVIVLCTLSTGGQRQPGKGQQQTPPSFIPDTQKRKASAKPSDWRMPDGRVLEFPASTSKEEIDEFAKRIAQGAVELPPGARVVGWEPVEGTTSLLPRYAERVGTIPTTRGKLDALANAAGILQMQIDLVDSRNKLTHLELNTSQRREDELANAVNMAGMAAANADSKLLMITNELDDLKRELDKFKDAACPMLRRVAKGPRRSWDDVAGTMADQNVQMRLDTACGLR